ncbi:hypothetical protein CR201_G0054522 [Pongo abelii]|uniref:Cep192-like domain-containing protein n=1 Tax=Pongo abelii TaxID=9601 RepID=A0A2J8R2N5_PONAB|nr:hypothetical protein CR201_G0054522 [Pongo abelii]
MVNHMTPACYEGQSPKKQLSSSEIQDSGEDFVARVDVGVDSANPTPVLSSVDLQERTETAASPAPRDLQVPE